MQVWKQIIVVAILGGLAFGGYRLYEKQFATPEDAGGRSGPRTVTVETAPATITRLETRVEAVGTTRARQSVHITPYGSGRVREITIEPGSRVSANQVLARLDDEIERADFAEAQAQLSESRITFERLSQLQQTNAVARVSVDEAERRLSEAQASVERAKRRLEDRTIRAPFSGVVGLTEIDLGAQVDDETTLARLDDLSEIEVEFALPETFFARVAPGQSVNARSAAFPDQEFEGRVTALDSRIDPVSRSFRVRAVIPNPDNTLPAGMFMSLSIVLEVRDALVVPEEAIVVQSADTYVFIIEDDTARRVSVETGIRRDGMVSLTSGIEAGAEVITRGLQRVRDGAPVRLLNAEAGQGGQS